MSVIRPAQLTNDASSVWMNSVQDGIAEHNMSVSSDFIQKTGPTGKFLSLHPRNKYASTFMNYTGEWDAMSGYSVNDVVRVLSNKDYVSTSQSCALNWKYPPQKISPMTDTNGIDFYTDPPNPALNTAADAWRGIMQVQGVSLPDAGIVIPYFYPMPGTYVCVSPVPSMDDAVINVVLHGGPQGAFSSMTPYDNITDEGLAQIYSMRMWDVNYFPTWPELPNVADLNPHNLQTTWGRYWELLSLLPTVQRTCKNGEQVVTYVDADQVPTGSANIPPPP